MRNRRRRIWIDRFPKRPWVRLALYFMFYLAIVWPLYLITAPMNAITEPTGPVVELGLSLIAAVSITIGLVCTFDWIRATRRVVRPFDRICPAILAIRARETLEANRRRRSDRLSKTRNDWDAQIHEVEKRRSVTQNNWSDSKFGPVRA
jgi:hypothetical protein